MIKLLLIFMLLAVIPSLDVKAMGNLPSSVLGETLVGKLAPDYTLESTSGTSRTLSQLFKGNKTIMIFWATWCPHCREELAALKPQLNIIKNKGVQILLINVGETKEEAKDYLASHQVPLESLVDEDNTMAGRYSVIGIPTLYFIDEQGLVIDIDHDFPLDYDARFKSKQK